MLYESQYYGVMPLGDELYHHGIKGQKWGVRRFRNEDGSLTAAGKSRYYSNDGKLTKYGEKQYKKDTKRLRKLEERADVDLQKEKAERYTARAGKAMRIARKGLVAMVGSHLVGAPLDTITTKPRLSYERDFDVLARGIRKGGTIGGAVATAGGTGAYIYNKVQASAAKKRMTDLGHEKAVADVKRQMDYMKQAYGNVSIDDLRKRKR